MRAAESTRLVVCVVCVAGALLLAACQPGANLTDRHRDADALASTFPVLTSLQVVAYRDQDWCRNIAYRGGVFSTEPMRATCNLFAGQPVAMPGTPSGEPGFARVRDALRRAQSRGGPAVRFFNADYGPGGRLTAANFALDCSWPFCKSRTSYIYAPDGPAPQAMSHTGEVQPAGPGWYLVREVH